MMKQRDRWIDKVMYRRMLRRWARLADMAEGLDLESLRRYRGQALSLRRNLDRVIHQAEHRLALPLIGSDAAPKPIGSDWAWRPEPWYGPIAFSGLSSVKNQTSICDGVKVFHDCPHNELTVRQLRNSDEAHLAPFGLRMDVFRFEGSFLSLVLELPDAAVEGLRLTHLIGLNATVEAEKPLEIYARLNVKQGPNVEQIVRQLPLEEGGANVFVEFDLAYTKLAEKQIDRIWVDLIFDRAEMNQITLRDVTFSRRPRAEL
ncbi:hypothetical protein EOK75_11005 [Pseudorhodobacter turbinis]|uniref:Uncharacterized protein n=1 Tax=Pseudorhodobacter turbinis TaxID=2500533 RepID=A0A4P8EGC8_9RHOB|nr:DUF6478 family protein [Pseudorhodobacter turbinis]QCO56210.1 hypothetical protein EOK75_11005 [Pseudorhodobacter turbinis]